MNEPEFDAIKPPVELLEGLKKNAEPYRRYRISFLKAHLGTNAVNLKVRRSYIDETTARE